MLVVRRRAGESLMIGDNVEIQILEVGSTQVKLGIVAPKEIAILRMEVHVTRQQNEAASREVSAVELANLTSKLKVAT
jgi:carbon storage regulator